MRKFGQTGFIIGEYYQLIWTVKESQIRVWISPSIRQGQYIVHGNVQ